MEQYMNFVIMGAIGLFAIMFGIWFNWKLGAKKRAQKKAEARKRQKVVELKEIKLRPNIDTHDYEVKAKAMHRFFDEGDKVKVTLRFRGREMAHQDLGLKLLEKVRTDVEEIAKVEAHPKLEGRQMIMVMAPR